MRPADNAISVLVNGAPQRFAAGITVAELLAHIDVVGRRVAVERNGEIVPRSQHGQTRLADGDRLEIVIAMGGG